MNRPDRSTAAVAGAGAVVLFAAALLERTFRPVREIRRYAYDTRAATEHAIQNLRGVAELERTREASAALARNAHGYGP